MGNENKGLTWLRPKGVFYELSSLNNNLSAGLLLPGFELRYAIAQHLFVCVTSL
jgi:hypothetical protein